MKPYEELRTDRAEHRFIKYPGAAHSFDVERPATEYLGFRIGYDAPDTRYSRDKMIEFFTRHLAPAPKTTQ